jgi:hypothetical protein
MTDTGIPESLRRQPSQPSLPERIRAGHLAVIEAGKNVVRRAMEVGALLNEAKLKQPHGKWLPWLTENCPEVPERTAQRYMKLADEKEKLEKLLKSKSATMADLTLNEACQWLEEGGEVEAESEAESEADDESETDKEEETKSSKTSDKVDKIADRLIAALKELKKSNAETAIAAAFEIVRRLQDAGFLEEKKKKAA